MTPGVGVLKFECRHRYDGGFQIELGFEVDVHFAALFGPSGSGKTSILSMIAGLLRPQSGRITVAGRRLLDTTAGVCLPPEARNVGVVFQDSLLFPHLSVASNLRYGARWRKKKKRSVTFERVVEVLEIGGLLDRFPRNLSGGERQRVALGRALLSGPELLLMDEPLASLDAPLKARVLAYLERAVAEWNIPTLFVTHSQAEVRRAADTVMLIESGRLLETGPPERVLARPEPFAWGNAAGPVNWLRVEAVEQTEGMAVARIGEQRLNLLPSRLPEHRPFFVEFSPADVVLSRRDVSGLSSRNHLAGRVGHIVRLDQSIFVAVDVGQILWAVLTPQAVAELELAAGCEVMCLIKVHSLRVVE